MASSRRAVRQLFETRRGTPVRIRSAAAGRADMKRVLIIPAAGRGTRLGWDGPKALCPVAGRPMIDHLFERYGAVVDRFVVVAAPSAAAARRQFSSGRYRADAVVQEQPTGMLPAILCARSVVETHQPEQIWITWCDQIAHQRSKRFGRLAAEIDRASRCRPWSSQPCDSSRRISISLGIREGRIVDVLQRREGDDMPPSAKATPGCLRLRLGRRIWTASSNTIGLPSRGAAPGSGTSCRSSRGWLPATTVRTFDVPDDAREAVGVNTPDELRLIEAYLRGARLSSASCRSSFPPTTRSASSPQLVGKVLAVDLSRFGHRQAGDRRRRRIARPDGGDRRGDSGRHAAPDANGTPARARRCAPASCTPTAT